MATTNSIMNKNLPLESLRGIAAIAVVIFHFNFTTPLVNNPLIQHAYVMVDFFFVLSGFVIAMNYQHRLENFNAVWQFQCRRFWRLYPLHFFIIMIFVLRDLRFAISQCLNGHMSPPMFQWEYVPKLGHNLLLTQAMFVEKLSFNWPSWSISTEFYTYLVFALTVCFFKRFRILAYLLLIAGSGWLAWQWGFGLKSASLYGIYRCLYSFFLGAMAYEYYRHFPANRKSFLPTCLLITSLVSVITLTDSQIEMVIPLIFCITIVAVASMENQTPLKKLLSHRVLVYLGKISYSVYMTHAFVILMFLTVMRRYTSIPTTTDARGYIHYNTHPLTGTLLILLAIAIVIGISHLTYHLIEDRFRRGLCKQKTDQAISASAKV